MVEGLNARLKESRLRAGLSQPEVADRLGLDRSSITAYESTSATTPSATVLIKLAGIYNVSLNWLAGIERENTVCLDGLPKEDQTYVLQLISRLEYLNNKVLGEE